jgi:hypothetical protein
LWILFAEFSDPFISDEAIFRIGHADWTHDRQHEHKHPQKIMSLCLVAFELEVWRKVTREGFGEAARPELRGFHFISSWFAEAEQHVALLWRRHCDGDFRGVCFIRWWDLQPGGICQRGLKGGGALESMTGAR